MSSKAQRFFPEQCRYCPTLNDLILHGDLDDDSSREEYVAATVDAGLDMNVGCPGPFNYSDEYGRGSACSRMLLDYLTRQNDREDG